MKHADIRRLFPNASRSCLAANAPHPELFGIRAIDQKAEVNAVRTELEPSNEVSKLGSRKGKETDSRRFLVRVTSYRRILLDEDNLCEKYVVDCCRYSGLLPSDRPGQTSIEVRQVKVAKGEEETIVEIFQL